jgi:hypothetical protein
MAMGNLDAIAKRLIEHGLPATTPAAVIMDGTRPEQRSVVGMLATIAEDAVRAELAAPAIVIVGDVVKLREELRWFDNAPLFGKRILITRPLDAAAAFASAVYARGSRLLRRVSQSRRPMNRTSPIERSMNWLRFVGSSSHRSTGSTRSSTAYNRSTPTLGILARSKWRRSARRRPSDYSILAFVPISCRARTSVRRLRDR